MLSEIRVPLAGILLACFSFAQPSQTPLPESQRTEWFRDAKFGMFIHWGVYSVIGRHEWARDRFQIPQSEYDQFARSFNPVHFNADAWVDLAKNAGARYMVITSKHHDGFSIYRSKVSDYDMEITPYPGDPLQQLADAAKRKGMRLGFYHSIMDWHNPDYVPKRTWEAPGQQRGGNIDKYIEFMKAQLRELLTGYGDVATMWFDGEWEHSTQEMHSNEVYDFIRKLQPNTLINDRLFKREAGSRGDYGTPEQFVPATGYRDKTGKPALWEACVTINTDSWGYNKYETDFKTTRDLIRMLVEVVSKGGNLLLNIGPMPDGRIQPEFVTRLNAIGDWMRVNNEAIYGTTASPFTRLPFFGRATTKGSTLYLHVFQWPADGRLRIPGLANKIRSVRILGNPGAKPAAVREGDDAILNLNSRAPDEIASVVAVELDGPPRVTSDYAIRPDADGSLRLGADASEIESRLGQRAKKENLLGHVYLTQLSRGEDRPTWIVNVPREGDYAVEISYGASPGAEGNAFLVHAASGEIQGHVKRTAGDLVFKTFPVGTIHLKAGEQPLQIRVPEKAHGMGVNLEYLKLKPVG
jgi:alpha-L-fucosidase